MSYLQQKIILFVEFKKPGITRHLWINPSLITSVDVAADGKTSIIIAVDSKSYTVEGDAVAQIRKAMEAP